jgi:hypothetical protein
MRDGLSRHHQANGKLILTVLSGLAEYERTFIETRTDGASASKLTEHQRLLGGDAIS